MNDHASEGVRVPSTPRARAAAAVVLSALVLVPAPLLPPGGLVGALQSWAGVGRPAAYLVAAIGLHTLFYGTLGVLAALTVDPGRTRRQRWQRLLLVPLTVVGIALVVRTVKLGHVPMLANAAVPMVTCMVGTAIGLAFRQHGTRPTLLASAIVAVLLAVLHWPGASSGTRDRVAAQLQRLVAAGPTLPRGDARFGRMLQLAFSPDAVAADSPSAVDHNCDAILALGIVIGHERLSRFAGLDRNGDLVQAAVKLRAGTTLRDREDWARHFWTSAALAIVENAFVSDLGGLLKEELDSLTLGTGFSFGDLAADRAGVRFATVATDSSEAALATQAHLQAGFVVGDVFPPVEDLAENLTVEQFRADYGGVGAPRYRVQLAEIEARLDGCAALRSR